MAEAQALVGEVERLHHGASHHVWARRTLDPTTHAIREASSDAGEPPGTAGRPILDVLAGARLVNAALVVSRWFGGVKLGKGGLARAYGESARAAIAAARLVPLNAWRRVDVEAPFSDAGAVGAAAARFGARIESVAPADAYRAVLWVPAGKGEELERALAELTGARARVVFGGVALRRRLTGPGGTDKLGT